MFRVKLGYKMESRIPQHFKIAVSVYQGFVLSSFICELVVRCILIISCLGVRMDSDRKITTGIRSS